jgi:DNA-binding CsgD family transcriptional regulator
MPEATVGTELRRGAYRELVAALDAFIGEGEEDSELHFDPEWPGPIPGDEPVNQRLYAALQAVQRCHGERLPAPAWELANELLLLSRGKIKLPLPQRVIRAIVLAEQLQNWARAQERSTVPKRRRRVQRARPLTPKQVQAVQVVGECQGNMAEAARRLGVHPATVRQHYLAATKKVPEVVSSVARAKLARRRLPADHRGQPTIADA